MDENKYERERQVGEAGGRVEGRGKGRKVEVVVCCYHVAKNINVNDDNDETVRK